MKGWCNCACWVYSYLAIRRLLFFPHSHATIIEHPAHVVIQGLELLVEALGEDVHLVLEMGALLAHLLVRHAAIVLDFGAELRAGRAEEIRLVLDVALTHQALLRHVEIYGQQPTDGLHGCYGLVLRERACGELFDEGVAVEVVDVGGRC